MHVVPCVCLKVETSVGVFTREAWRELLWWRSGAGEVKDWVQKLTMHPPKKDEVIAVRVKMTGQLAKHLMKKKPLESPATDRMVPESPRRQGDPVGNQGRQQDGGGWYQWQGKAKVGMGIVWECPKTIAEMVE